MSNLLKALLSAASVIGALGASGYDHLSGLSGSFHWAVAGAAGLASGYFGKVAWDALQAWKSEK